MKFLNELLGFAVLTGPLWLILIVLPVAIWFAVKSAKRFDRRSIKIAIGLLVFLLVFFVPFADEIGGRFYLSYLCANEAGVKVYQTVELPAEYWDERGKPKLRTFKSGTPGIITLVGTKEPFLEESSFTEPYSDLLHVQKAGFRLREINSKRIVGEVVYFRYWGGWLARNFSPDRSATSCHLQNLDGWEHDIFKRSA
jgi:hypothetical protein